MAVTVLVKESGKEVIYFRINKTEDKVFVERPDAPSIELQPQEDLHTTLAAAFLSLKTKGHL